MEGTRFSEQSLAGGGELLFPGAFPIDSSIKKIVCHNDIERAILLNLLRKESPKEFSKYKNNPTDNYY